MNKNDKLNKTIVNFYSSLICEASILDVRFLFKFGDQNLIDSFINDSRFLRWQTSDLMRQLEKENELCE